MKVAIGQDWSFETVASAAAVDRPWGSLGPSRYWTTLAGENEPRPPTLLRSFSLGHGQYARFGPASLAQAFDQGVYNAVERLEAAVDGGGVARS